MDRGKSKKPKHKRVPPSTKSVPKVPLPTDPEVEKVRYTFVSFDPCKWHDDGYKPVPFNDIAKHLQAYEQRTWRNIRDDHRRDHPINPDIICAIARTRLASLHVDDMDELWRFRFGAKMRIWGARYGREFRVLWWDPQHKICPSKLKHT